MDLLGDICKEKGNAREADKGGIGQNAKGDAQAVLLGRMLASLKRKPVYK